MASKVILKEFKNQKEFIEAFERAKIYNWNKDELEVYDYVSLREGRKRSEIETAREDGKMEGKMEAKIEIAKNLLDILDNETIESNLLLGATSLVKKASKIVDDNLEDDTTAVIINILQNHEIDILKQQFSSQRSPKNH